MTEKCQTTFLDCLSYYDLGSQIISLFATIFILYKCIRNYIGINRQKNDIDEIEYKKSMNRKLIVNGIQITYLTSLSLSIIMSIALFPIYLSNNNWIKQYRLNLWYKLSQVIFINIFNCLSLTVGILYWKAIRAYYKLSQFQLPLGLKSWFKVIFIVLYIYNITNIIIFLGFIFLTDQNFLKYTGYLIINLICLGSVLFSTSICVITRTYYDFQILEKININSQVRRNQRLYSLILIICLILRTIIALTSSTISQSQQNSIRNIQQNCLDNYPFSSIILLLTTILIDLIPAYIFSRIFTTLSQQQKSYNQILHPTKDQQNQSNRSSYFI